jgi:hypothetical protein
LSLTANGVSNYTWTSSAGSLGTLSTLTLNPAQGVNNYTVYGYNPSLSCIGQLVVTVSVSPYPVIGISGPTMVCVGEAPIYTAVGASNFTWTSGSGNLYGTSITPTLTSAQNYTVSAGNSGSHCVSKQVLSIGTSICSGLNAYHTEGIRIYPNPFYGKLQLSSVKAFTLKVFELSGRLIYRDDASATEREMDLSAFSAGVYLVEMSSDEGVTYCKVLKLVNP